MRAHTAAIVGLGTFAPNGPNGAAPARAMPNGGAPTKGRRNVNSEIALLRAATRLALADAGSWSTDAVEGEGTVGYARHEGLGVVVATDRAGLRDYTELFCAGASGEIGAVSPARGPMTGLNGPAAQLSIDLGARGPNMTLAGGAVGALDALAYAADALRVGDAETMLVGAVELPADAVAVPRDAVAPAQGTAAAVILEAGARAEHHGRRVRALLGAVASAFSPRGDRVEASARCLATVLAGAASEPIATLPAGTGDGAAGALMQIATAVAGLERGTLLVYAWDEDCSAGAALIHAGDANAHSPSHAVLGTRARPSLAATGRRHEDG